ncbi:MAG: AAA domain-containing protein [Piptocephalis tieghemiana]|nr:MAG: AAA domain-containing protein [Piptocephalis tieghemiana]
MPPQALLILVGPPASGKSTFSHHLCRLDPSWKRVNQDDLGSRVQCEAVCSRYLRLGANVVVDRCNFNAAQRSTWIRLGREYGTIILAISFYTPPQICEMRLYRREDHPTGVFGHQGVGILHRFLEDLKYPEQPYEEGIHRHLRIQTPLPSQPSKPLWLPADQAWRSEDIHSIMQALIPPSPPSPSPP